MKIFRSFSPRETERFGERLAKRALSKRAETAARARHGGGERRAGSRRGALVFALTGELGAGKTTFVRGFFKGLGIKKRTASPTFVIMRRQPLRKKRFTNVFHADAYRLKKAGDMQMLGFEEILSDPRNVILIEWAEKIKRMLPKGAVRLKFRHGGNASERKIARTWPRRFLL